MSYPLTIAGPQPSGDWTTANPTLDQFELGCETDTGKAKLGDGVTAWADLAYWNPGGTVGSVSDTAYDATSWNGVTAVAPSKNAVRDEFETVKAGITITAAEAADTITPCADGAHSSPTSITTKKGIITAIS